MATEAGNQAADASIQALGGYGYTHEYLVEKISRDVRITTIYEGTSEIMEMTISRDRWQLHLKTRGQHYHEKARELEALHARQPNVGANFAALAHHALAEAVGESARRPSHPLPAHSPASGRVDRLCGMRRQLGAPRRASRRKQTERKGEPSLRRHQRSRP